MNDVVIKVENLSKQYRLGTIGTGTLSHDLNRAWAKIRGKEDPYSKIGDINDRTQVSISNYAWVLKDINFEVRKGEVLGVIGKNGAGKSTLLKILSRVTSPTQGTAKMKGRVGSLLEVGTGFHPELTGRENIFLNGAILGMRKWEISKQLDEIIDFAGVEKYIDTPVKRYSSGMKVRLGFAVAAHLEPEILIVDEVLAVGDAEFQSKCIGKMQDVSHNQGRTILFVSHNMAAVTNLCDRAIMLERGTIVADGSVPQVIDKYLLKHESPISKNIFEEDVSKKINIVACNFKQGLAYQTALESSLDIEVEVELKKRKTIGKSFIAITVLDSIGNEIFFTSSEDDAIDGMHLIPESNFKRIAKVPPSVLKPGSYYITISLYEKGVGNLDKQEGIRLNIVDTLTKRGQNNLYRRNSLVAPLIYWD